MTKVDVISIFETSRTPPYQIRPIICIGGRKPTKEPSRSVSDTLMTSILNVNITEDNKTVHTTTSPVGRLVDVWT